MRFILGILFLMINFPIHAQLFGTSIGFWKKTSPCPDNYIFVPGNERLGVNSFCVMKFEAKDVGGVATSQSLLVPWLNIDGTDAFSECSDLNNSNDNGEYSLISNTEWMTIARNIENVASNWSGGSVGSGHIGRGHSDNSPASGQAVSDTTDPYSDTGNNSGQAAGSGWEQRRTQTLSNGAVIWDFAGNVSEWIDWDSLSAGINDGAGGASSAWRDIDNLAGNLINDDLGPLGSYTHAHSVGRWYGGNAYVIRGGEYTDGDKAGIYSLLNNESLGSTSSRLGFRCVFRPKSKCPGGFIAIPGNATIGTEDFCVMQFEAKDYNSSPISRAAGTPWVSITATDSQTECNSMSTTASSGSFDQITNPEWITIARNIENVATNWSGGSVGSGQVNKGHTDNSPSNSLEVSDLTDPYDGTGNNSGQSVGSGWEQKRSFNLSNGKKIWDFAGNVAERVDWSTTSGYTAPPTDASAAWREITSLAGSFVAGDISSAGGYNSSQGLGQWYGGNGGAIYRGGYWNDLTYGGIFNAWFDAAATQAISNNGFRCVFRPRGSIVSTSGVFHYNDGGYAKTCKEYREFDGYASEGDGLYWIDPDGDGGNAAVKAYCDMTTDGGGWTLIANRRADPGNDEGCGSNLNAFFNGTCGIPDNVAHTYSYSMGRTVRNTIPDIGEWLFIGGSSSSNFDTDDAYIIHSTNDLFPNNTGNAQQAVTKVCDINNDNCDTTNVYFKYTGAGVYSGARCNGTYSGSYSGVYGYCHNGVGTTATMNGLFGNRTGYSEVKLWGYASVGDDYHERIFVR